MYEDKGKSSLEGLFERLSQPNWFSKHEPVSFQAPSAKSADYRRKTKIICTLGNHTFTSAGIEELLKNGMDIARLNLAYINTRELQTEIIGAFTEVCSKTGKKCPLLVDLQGPSIRIGNLPNGTPIILNKGDEINITTNRHLGTNASLVYCDCQNLPHLLKPGYKILLDKGKVILNVKAIKPEKDMKLEATTTYPQARYQNLSMIELHGKRKEEAEAAIFPSGKHEKKVTLSKALQEKRDIEEHLADDIFRRIVFDTVEKPALPPVLSGTKRPLNPDWPAKPLVKKKEKLIIQCEVEYDCVLKPYDELFIPKLGLKKDLGISIIDVKDVKDVSFWAENGADFVAIPHVESVEDINDVRELIGNRPIKVLAKIQNKIALQNLESIIVHSDGIMIGRSVLALSLSPAHLAFIQDYIVAKCKLKGKPVIISSPIMDSMVKSPIPTRAEVADVSLAVTQGADSLTLGSETAIGEFYADSVKAVSQICVASELNTSAYGNYISLIKQLRAKGVKREVEDVICSCATKAGLDLDVSLIVVFTTTGNTALKVSKFRPKAEVLVVTGSEAVATYCTLGYGLNTFFTHNPDGEGQLKELIFVKNN